MMQRLGEQARLQSGNRLAKELHFRNHINRRQYRVQRAVQCTLQEPARFKRRTVLAQQLLLGATAAVVTPKADAVGFQKELKKRKIPIDEYSTLEDGIQYYDLSSGNGELVLPGKAVHFDVMYKALDVVSTRSARLLGGNRSVAEPFEFTVGSPISEVGVRKINDSANGLFSGQAGVKPPPALSTAVIGMKTGGKRIVSVPPELGYGDKGFQEIPPGATVQLTIELLRILK